jgi:GTP-dependent dephospho-CoA kinase
MKPPADSKILRDRRITDEIRLELKKPWGKIVSLEELIVELKNNKELLISVGDITTLELINAGIVPDVSFIDFKFKRRDITSEEKAQLLEIEAKTIKIKNAPGIISADLMEVCKIIFTEKTRSIKVIVDGEEDLAALAAAIYAPLGSIIVYGQPDEGAVLMHLNDKYKNLAEKYYSDAESV